MKWIRRAKVAWRRAVRRNQPSRSPPSSSEISRREFLLRARDVALLATAATALQSCALMVTREHGFNRDFDTRRPDSSVKKVVESFPDVGKLEVGFIKERKAGQIVGASTYRTPSSTGVAYNNWTRDPRSTLHTHPISTDGPVHLRDSRVHTYPSSTDFHWIMERINQTSEYPPTMRAIHVMPVTPEGKAMGFSTIRLGKEWLKLEKAHPEIVKYAWQYYSSIQRAYAHESITMDEYGKRIHDFFALMKPNGLQVHVTAYPGFKVENGFLVPKEK